MASPGPQNEVVVVTGAGGGLGSAVVRTLLSRGATVVGFDRTPAIELGPDEKSRYFPVEVDLGDRRSIVDGYAVVDRETGPLTGLVNLAATWSTTHAALDLDEPEWNQVIAVNLTGTLWMCQEALRRMMPQHRGAIVNISSLQGLMASMTPMHAYATSKAGVIGLTRSLAAEAAQHGVRINCIAPGLHVTPAVEAGLGEEGARKYLEGAIKTTPIGFVAEPADMVGPVLFLLSEDSRNIIGQTIVSDGGRGIWFQ